MPENVHDHARSKRNKERETWQQPENNTANGRGHTSRGYGGRHGTIFNRKVLNLKIKEWLWKKLWRRPEHADYKFHLLPSSDRSLLGWLFTQNVGFPHVLALAFPRFLAVNIEYCQRRLAVQILSTPQTTGWSHSIMLEDRRWLGVCHPWSERKSWDKNSPLISTWTSCFSFPIFPLHSGVSSSLEPAHI